MGGLAALNKRLSDLNDEKTKVNNKKSYYSDLKSDIEGYYNSFGGDSGYQKNFASAWKALKVVYNSSYLTILEQFYDDANEAFKTLNSNFEGHIETLSEKIKTLRDELDIIKEDIKVVEGQIEDYDEDDEDG